MHEEAVETQPLIAQEGARPSPPGPLDVTDEDSVRAWVAEAADAFGGIDIVYADAHAAAAVRVGAIASQPYEGFASTMRAELDSVWLTAAHLAWPHLYAAAAASARRPGGPAPPPTGALPTHPPKAR